MTVQQSAMIEEAKKFSKRRRGIRIDTRKFVLVPAILAVLLIGGLTNSAFLTPNNLIGNVLTTSAVLGTLVVAESIVLIGGRFDLSLESIVGFAPMLLVVLHSSGGEVGAGLPLAAAAAVTTLVVVLIGLINGLMVAKLKLNAFIVTLAMLILIRGFTLGLSGGQTFSGLPKALTFLGSARTLGLPLQAWILVGIFVVAWFVMEHTVAGRYVYAVGGNEAAAKAAGVPTFRVTLATFVIGSLLAAFSGFLLTARIASVTASQGEGLIFTVFAAAVIGGISLDGGRGDMLGAGLGVLLLGLIQNLLTLSDVPSFWINAAYGAIIIGALLMGWVSQMRGGRA